jgi:hypothetical protein
VVPGLEKGIMGMKAGEQRQVFFFSHVLLPIFFFAGEEEGW